MLHLAEERVEAVCRPDGAYRLEVLTRAVSVGCGIDGRSPCAVVRHMLSRGKAQALAMARASIAETQLPHWWHKTKVEGFVNSGNHDANIQKLFLKREINPGFLHYSWWMLIYVSLYAPCKRNESINMQKDIFFVILLVRIKKLVNFALSLQSMIEIL